jgi:ABC-type branched-subunit amino acid transport system ATPase component
LRIYGNQRVYDNLLLARRWKGVPAFMWMWIAPKPIRDKADDLIEFLKIDHVRTVLANNLSGGQQRLLEIGMTLMNDPVVVLLDEATSGVNPALVEEIKADIRRLNEERGITFFLVEHNMSFAMELCNRIYVLDYGELIAEGTPLEIQNNERVIEAYFGRDE